MLVMGLPDTENPVGIESLTLVTVPVALLVCP